MLETAQFVPLEGNHHLHLVVVSGHNSHVSVLRSNVFRNVCKMDAMKSTCNLVFQTHTASLCVLQEKEQWRSANIVEVRYQVWYFFASDIYFLLLDMYRKFTAKSYFLKRKVCQIMHFWILYNTTLGGDGSEWSWIKRNKKLLYLHHGMIKFLNSIFTWGCPYELVSG